MLGPPKSRPMQSIKSKGNDFGQWSGSEPAKVNFAKCWLSKSAL